jgi:hypothetical protein
LAAPGRSATLERVKRRKRGTAGVGVLGAGVLALLLVAHWGTVRDHVETWHCQLTRKTEAIIPDPALKELRLDGEGHLLRSQIARAQDSTSLIFLRLFATTSGHAVILPADDRTILDWQVILPTRPEEVGTDIMKDELEAMGRRVLKQRFPRRAYVILRDPSAKVTLPTHAPGSNQTLLRKERRWPNK